MDEHLEGLKAVAQDYTVLYLKEEMLKSIVMHEKEKDVNNTALS